MAHVMIVDDNWDYRNLLTKLCAAEGHVVTALTNAEEALHRLRGNGVPPDPEAFPDLMIVDFNMEGMNGFELIRDLRQDDDLRRIPALLVTGSTKDFRDLVAVEGVCFASKTSPLSDILAGIRQFLKPADGHALGPEPTPHSVRWGDFNPNEIDRTPVGVPANPEPVSHAGRWRELNPGKIDGRIRGNAPAPAIAPLAAPREASKVDVPGCSDALGSIISESAVLSERIAVGGGTPADGTGGDEKHPDSPVARLVHGLVLYAINRGASDIHIEPQRGWVQVRVRVDGSLQSAVRLPDSIRENLCARIKVLCNLNITEKRLPQDGQFSVQAPDGQMVKFRVNTLPTVYGERVVLRLLRSGELQVDLESLELSGRNKDILQRSLLGSNGLILVTGPTGSGKTTTLYSMLKVLNTGDVNIVTAEDPVEYQLDGISQVQVRPSIGYSFERVLRSFLRQDPDIMLVGEIRDAETAEIALKAAVTGHMVLSTLHTNDAAGAVSRLTSMGLPPYLVAAACRVVVAQRLVRVLCRECRQEGGLHPSEAAILTQEERGRLARVWRPKGCPLCHGIGYRGRKAVVELMPVLSHEIREAIVRGESPHELVKLAKKEGMVSLREEALRACAEGISSPEEAFATILAE